MFEGFLGLFELELGAAKKKETAGVGGIEGERGKQRLSGFDKLLLLMKGNSLLVVLVGKNVCWFHWR